MAGEAGARTAVAQWNKALGTISLHQLRYPDRTSIVEYDRLFGDPEAGALRRVLDRVGLEYGAEISDTFDQMHQQYVTSIRSKDRSLPPEDEEHVARQADLREWKHVVSYAL